MSSDPNDASKSKAETFFQYGNDARHGQTESHNGRQQHHVAVFLADSHGRKTRQDGAWFQRRAAGRGLGLAGGELFRLPPVVPGGLFQPFRRQTIESALRQPFGSRR